MKIGLVYKKYSNNGGTERYVLNLADYLLGQGLEVHLITARIRTTPPDKLQVHRLHINRRSRGAKILDFDKQSAKKVDEIGLDCVMGFGKTTRQNVLRSSGGAHGAYRAAMKPFMPWLKNIMDDFRNANKVINQIEFEQFRHPKLHCAFAVSKFLKLQICEEHKVSPSHIQVIHPGVDLQTFHPSPNHAARKAYRSDRELSPSELVVGFLGNNYLLKGLDMLFEAAVQNPQLHLVVGGQDEVYAWRRKARHLGIKNRVHFLGIVHTPQVIFDLIDVFALPSRYDTFANVCLEAMACGIPVVTSNMNGSHEIIRHGESGLIVDIADSAEGLNQAFGTLQDDLLRERMAEAAIETARNMGRQAHFQAVCEIMQECAGNPVAFANP